jgi:hypothetical protein
MADTNLLAALLSGSNPLAPQMLGGYQGAQLSDAALNPTFAHNEGPFGALAKTLAGFSGAPMLRQAVEATTAARTGANPELARMLAGNDPFTMAAAPGANPVATAQILAGATPANAAEARLANAQATLAGNQALAAARVGTARPSTVGPSSASGAPSSPSASGAAPLSLGNGFADPVAGILAMPPGSPQQAAAWQRLSTPQKAAAAARLRAQGGGGAR